MKRQIIIVAFGDKYLSLLMNTLESLEFIKYKKYFNTLLITGSSVNESIESYFNKVIITSTPKNYVDFQSYIMKKFYVNSEYQYNMFLSPDTIWSKDALSIVLEDMDKLYKASFIHYRRTNDALLVNEKIDYPIDAFNLYNLSRKYTHPLHVSHNLYTQNSSMWPEYYYLDDDNSEINYIVNKEPLYIHRDIILDKFNHVNYFSKNNIRIYGSTSDIFCVSLAEKNKYEDWIDLNSRLTLKKLCAWLRNYSINDSMFNFRGNPILWKVSEDKIINSDILKKLKKYDLKLQFIVILDKLMFYLINKNIEEGFEFIQKLKNDKMMCNLTDNSIILIIFNKTKKNFTYQICNFLKYKTSLSYISFYSKVFFKIEH